MNVQKSLRKVFRSIRHAPNLYQQRTLIHCAFFVLKPSSHSEQWTIDTQIGSPPEFTLNIPAAYSSTKLTLVQPPPMNTHGISWHYDRLPISPGHFCATLSITPTSLRLLIYRCIPHAYHLLFFDPASSYQALQMQYLDCQFKELQPRQTAREIRIRKLTLRLQQSDPISV